MFVGMRGNIRGKAVLTLRSFAKRPYNCRSRGARVPVPRSTFKLRHLGQVKTQRIVACCFSSEADVTTSSLQSSSSKGTISLPTSMWMFGRRRRIISSSRSSSGSRDLTSSSDAVEVTRNGAASANRILCRCSSVSGDFHGIRGRSQVTAAGKRTGRRYYSSPATKHPH